MGGDAALLAQRAVGEDEFYRALARHLGTAFVTHGAQVAPGIDIAAASAAGMAPLTRWPGGPRWIIAPRGRAITQLLAQGRAQNAVITSPRRLDQFLRDANTARIAQDAASTLSDDASARYATIAQVWPVLAVTVAGYGFLAWLRPTAATDALAVALWFVFLSACALRIVAASASFVVLDMPRALRDAELPIYTIVIALYREARMAGDIVTALENLDYPGIRAQTPQALRE